MERLTKADRACATAATALVNDLNDELTVILSSVSEAIGTLEPGHPARLLLSDLENAALRCAGRCGVMQTFAARHGVRSGRASFFAVTQL